MDRQFDQDLLALKNQIAAMGGLVEKALNELNLAFSNRALEPLAKIKEHEADINRSHLEIDEKCLSLLAKNTPFAQDLRLILAVIKMNTDLERMGDQCTNISHCVKSLFKHPAHSTEQRIPEIAGEVRGMVRDCLDAFMKQDIDLAQRVLKRDDRVDSLKNEIFSDLVEMMKNDSSFIEIGLNLILVARNFERLADHATNIAEDVIFVATGEDVRHQKGRTQNKVAMS